MQMAAAFKAQQPAATKVWAAKSIQEYAAYDNSIREGHWVVKPEVLAAHSAKILSFTQPLNLSW